MSEEKARQQSMQFSNTKAVMDVLDIAYDAGIRTFMCTTHDRIAEVCDYIRANPQRYADFKMYPCMPYAHKYADAVTEEGLIGALKKFTAGNNMFSMLAKGGMAAVTNDFGGIMKVLVDAELSMFKGINTPVIFLQNVLVDLLLGLDFKTIFVEYAEYIREKYNAEPGFITMNLPKLVEVLEERGIENPIICSNINKIGFRMCGGKEIYEQIIREKKFRPIAMSVYASGAIPPKEALEYVCRQRNIESIVFGASSKRNIEQTKQLIEEFDQESNSKEKAAFSRTCVSD